ncbi:glycosyltransferase [uncultured Azohydromonas sp.]|jgi:Glycosyltransferase|uniref:glycosyltransferase n=1 Tax=uncultured Azohydromonas sp. TaxID=487342 RepID=UPI00261EDF46|nr:glycosyltransferase [uncultured Azohydromonas sp.]
MGPVSSPRLRAPEAPRPGADAQVPGEHAAPAPAAAPRPQAVVHVVGHVTAELLGPLRASLRACTANGLEACVVLIDRDKHRHCLVHLDGSAELFLVAPVRNPLSQWRAVSRTIDSLLHTALPQAVHLHGLLPCAVGVLALHRAGAEVPVYFSLYGFRTLNLLGRSAARVLSRCRSILQGTRPASIVYVPREERALQIWSASGWSGLGDAAGRASALRHESAQPLILSGGHAHESRGVKAFSQLAVLLGGGESRIGFKWIGPVGEQERKHLEAAGVRLLGTDDKDQTLHLTSGWIYVAPDVAEGFPVTLVCAMALGLPCVARDCEQHRQVIEHGRSGYLCGSLKEFMDHIGALLEDANLRERMGHEARQQAVLRFNAESLGRRLFAAYSLDAMAAGAISRRGQS